MALLGRSTALLLLLSLLCTALLFVRAAESESQAEASTEAATEVVAAAGAAAEATWKPRSYPRTNNVNRAPARHRFFLPNPCVLNDERTGAQFDLTPLRKTGSDTHTTSSSRLAAAQSECKGEREPASKD